MPTLNRNVQVTCGNCGTSITKHHLSRHKSRCSGGTLYCSKRPNFFTKSRDYLNYRMAKKHNAAVPKNNHSCKECSIEFPMFYSLRHHKQRYHTAETTLIGEKEEMQSLADAGDDKILDEELQSCGRFLVDFETQKGRHSMSNFVVKNLTLLVIEEKLDGILYKLRCAAKPNLAPDFFERISKTGNSDTFMLLRITPCWSSQIL